MGKQLTPLEQATADLKAAQKVHAAKQAALTKAYTAEQEAAGKVKEARDRITTIMDAEVAAAEKATKAAVGQETQPRTSRTARPRPASQGTLTVTEHAAEHAVGNGHQVMA